MLDIHIKTIPHNQHRYDTAGDYWTDAEGNEQIRITDMANQRHELLITVHEIIEDFLCQHRDIKEEDITAFDILFEKERAEGQHGDDEPGFDPRAPYIKEHTFSTCIEKMLAFELGVDWGEYETNIIAKTTNYRRVYAQKGNE